MQAVAVAAAAQAAAERVSWGWGGREGAKTSRGCVCWKTEGGGIVLQAELSGVQAQAAAERARRAARGRVRGGRKLGYR